jgi:poly(hydroxyalkanoate) depolymerase family esterase
MQKKLSTLFFSTARKVARLQRSAWGLGMPFSGLAGGTAARPAQRAKAKTKTAAPTIVAARRRGLVSTAPYTPDPSAFAGTWRGHVYRTPPLPGAWPVRLSYFVYTPPRLRKGSPMLVMLHGCEQSALDFACGTRMHRLADREGFLLVYPQQSQRGQRHRCWHWYQPDPAHGYAEADAIAGIVRETAIDHQVDATRIYIAGLSAGASMAALVALRHPDWIAALGMHSGAVLGSAQNASEGLRAMRYGAARPPAQAMPSLVPEDAAFPGLPAIILHGERDAVVDPRSGTQLMEQLAWVNGVPLDRAAPAQHYAAGTVRAYSRTDLPAGRSAMVTLCEIPGLGHAWSGGDGRIRFHSRQGPDASLLMWRFFKTRRREPQAGAEG